MSHLRILSKLPQNYVDTSGQVKDAPGDSYYIRAMFDRAAAECQALGQGQQHLGYLVPPKRERECAFSLFLRKKQRECAISLPFTR